MRRLKQYFAITALTLLPLMTAAQDVTTATCEYWIDGDFDGRKKIALSDNLQTTLDLSTLKKGLHTIGLRVNDGKGLWSSPLIRYFVRTPMYPSGAVPAGYEYWIDDYAQRVTGRMEGDALSIDVDASKFSKGLHTLTLRTLDSNGLWSSPIVRYFVRTPMYPSGAVPSGYEYWIDDYAQRVTGRMEGDALSIDIDASKFSKGLHTLTLRTLDSNGLWSLPIVRYFLHTGHVEPGTLRSYRYWVDNNIESAVTGETADGIINLEIDFSELYKGVHTLTLQAEDSNGRMSPAICKYFVVAQPIITDNNIVAYEYWFNRGKRTRVEVDPSNPLVIENLWIDIANVVPNNIPEDYRFDAIQETAWCNDQVFFGLQAFDAANRGTMAILSDTFAMEVPVKLNIIELKDDAAKAFTQPQKGEIKAFMMRSGNRSTLEWSIKGGSTIDFYSSGGYRLKATEVQRNDSIRVYNVDAEDERTFALVYSNAQTNEQQEIKCKNLTPTGINANNAAVNIYAVKGALIVETSEEHAVIIYDAQGRIIVDEIVNSTTRYRLQSGVYSIKSDGGDVNKILVP